MPDFVQGWLLLQDCNLDAAERNLVTTAAGGDFSLNRIIRELRTQFPDAEMKRRDSGRKHHGYLGSILEDEDEDNLRIIRELRTQFPDAEMKRRDSGRKHHGYLGSILEDEDEDNLDDREEISLIAEEDLTEEGMALWASATEEAETAYAAYQQARRTLREARHKQHAVKMSSRIVCMNCGKMGHRKANCPSSTAASSRREPESAPFVCYAGEPEGRAGPESALGTNVPTADAIAQGKCVVDCPILLSVASLRALGAIIDFQEDLMVLRNVDKHHIIELQRLAKPTTADAIAQGKCVVDCGATRSIGSIKALEQLMSQNIAKRGNSGVKQVDLQDKPVFNFGNSSENQCSSTVEMRLQAGEREGRLRIHALDMGQGPILLSVASLRALGAIIDFQEDLMEDLMVLRNVDKHHIIELERKKADLILFCTKQLRINVSESMTMNAMKRQAMLHIYQKSRPDPTDTVGFGKHSSLSYEEIKEHQPEYAKWVLVTARESSEADPRLLRLAGWLENNPSRVDMASQKMAQQAELRRELRMPMPEVDKPKGKKVEKAGSSHSASIS
eukprot:s7332_g2.t2